MVKTKRTKAPVLTPINDKEAEEVMGTYATLDAQVEQVQSKMDEEITAIRERYAHEIQTKIAARDEAQQKLQLYAESNKDRFAKKRSMDMSHGRIGFRTGTPKCTKAKGVTWAAATILMKEFLPEFVRTKEDPTKEMIIEKWGDKQYKDGFEKCKLEVVQEEAFFVELKKEENAS